jgi:asparagine N-glycosylation enzyme membrane subunit Stt3
MSDVVVKTIDRITGLAVLLYGGGFSGYLWFGGRPIAAIFVVLTAIFFQATRIIETLRGGFVAKREEQE